MSDPMKDAEVAELEKLIVDPADKDIDEIPNDEPEIITAEEVVESVSDSPIEPQEDHLTSLVCDTCLELNLTTKSSIQCLRCGKSFCLHFASTIDADYCVNCMSDVSVTKQIITKTYEHKNEETGQVTYYRRRAKETKIGGVDWLFAQRKIYDLTDAELDLLIAYHYNIYQLIVQEVEKRRLEKAHAYAKNRVVIAKPSQGVEVTSSTTTTVKKSRTISKDKAMEQLNAIMKAMLAAGKTPEQIAAMFAPKK